MQMNLTAESLAGVWLSLPRLGRHSRLDSNLETTMVAPCFKPSVMHWKLPNQRRTYIVRVTGPAASVGNTRRRAPSLMAL